MSAALVELGHDGALPPHDHPTMLVLSLLLSGSLREVAWRRDAATGEATVISNCTRVAGEAFYTHPSQSEGNIHCLTATSAGGARVLDWITPPYAGGEGSPDGPECTYYAWIPSDATSWVVADGGGSGPAVGTTGKLVALPAEPEGFECVGRSYLGSAVRLG